MRSKYFKIHELVPKKLYQRYGEKAWRYVDVRLIESIDKLKEHFNLGTMTINNYFWGGSREWSGIRTPDSKWYSYGSQHSYANAFDIIFSDYTAEEVRNYIINNPHEFPHIKGLELGVSWVHLDVRNEDNIILFKG
jgi:hypothetical protein